MPTFCPLCSTVEENMQTESAPDLFIGECLLDTKRAGSALKTIQLEQFLTNCYLHGAHWHLKIHCPSNVYVATFWAVTHMRSSYFTKTEMTVTLVVPCT